jgi:hypothetical protein
MNKDLFFYSSYCDHCKEIIDVITKKNIRELFIFVSVDTNKYKIPPCVTHVPTIITKQKDILTDVYIMPFINKVITSINAPVEEISPYSIGSSSGGYSSSYTWLTENGYDNDGKVSLQNENIGKNNYVIIGTDSRIFVPAEKDSSSKSNKFDDSTYESFLNNRNADDEFLKKQQQSYADR